jgi:hypothetical protein
MRNFFILGILLGFQTAMVIFAKEVPAEVSNVGFKHAARPSQCCIDFEQSPGPNILDE